MGLKEFRELVDVLRPSLIRVEVQAARRHGRGELGERSGCPETQVVVALRFFAGGSYLDLTQFDVLRKTKFYDTVRRVVGAVHAHMTLAMDSQSEQGRSALAASFRGALPSYPLADRVIGALDVIAIRLAGPPASSTLTPAEFYSRKGFFALNICDGDTRFIYVATGAPGSMHDSAACAQTRLGTDLGNNVLNLGRFVIFGADAYALSLFLQCPWPCQQLPMRKDAVNYFLSQLRQTIELSFGILNKRWGVLQRPLHLSLADFGDLIAALLKLHNFIVDHLPDAVDATGTSACNVDEPFMTMSDERAPGDSPEYTSRDARASPLRVDLTRSIQAAGRTRRVRANQ